MKGKHNKSPTRAEKIASNRKAASAKVKVASKSTAEKSKPKNDLSSQVEKQLAKQAEGEVELEIKLDRLTPEATAWLRNPYSIEGSVYLAFKPQKDGSVKKVIEPCEPWRYLGWDLINEAADIKADTKGVSLTLDDVQSMVKPEGEKVRCRGTGIEFQTMMWWRFCPHDMKKSLEAGVGFADLMPLEKWGGACFDIWIEATGEHDLQMYSGSTYKGDGGLSTGSPLIIAAKGLAKIINSRNSRFTRNKRHNGVEHIWGRSRAAVIDSIQARKRGKNAALQAHQELENNIWKQLMGKPAQQVQLNGHTNSMLTPIGDLIELDPEVEPARRS
jgi:hypothetical protein